MKLIFSNFKKLSRKTLLNRVVLLLLFSNVLFSCNNNTTEETENTLTAVVSDSKRNMNLTEEHRKSALVLVKDFRKKGINLDFSLESLQYLEQMLDEEIDERGYAKTNSSFEKDFGWELSKFGAYYGEVLIKQIPKTKWQREEERKDLQRSLGDSNLGVFGINLPDGETVYPMEMINNRIEKGKSKDIYFLAKALIEKNS